MEPVVDYIGLPIGLNSYAVLGFTKPSIVVFYSFILILFAVLVFCFLNMPFPDRKLMVNDHQQDKSNQSCQQEDKYSPKMIILFLVFVRSINQEKCDMLSDK